MTSNMGSFFLKSISVSCVSALLLSCTSKQDKIKSVNQQNVVLKDSVVFNVGFQSKYGYEGVTRDKTTGEQYVYFGDPVTEKKIKLFRLSGELAITIPLSNVVKELGTEIRMTMISPDTLIFYAAHNCCGFCTINRKGKVWNRVDLGEIKDEKSRRYEIFLPTETSSLDNLFFSCAIATDGFPNKPDSIDNYLKSFQYYYNETYKAPLLFKIVALFSKKPRIEFCISDYMSMVYAEPFAGVSFAIKSKIINNRIFIVCTYDNKIAIGSISNLRTENFITVHSKYTQLQQASKKLNSFKSENALNRYLEMQVNEMFKKGAISNFLYNKIEQRYLIQVSHRNEHSPKNFISKHQNFSLITYDENLKKGEEYFFDGRKFSDKLPLFMTDKGLFIPKHLDSYDNKSYYLVELKD